MDCGGKSCAEKLRPVCVNVDAAGDLSSRTVVFNSAAAFGLKIKPIPFACLMWKRQSRNNADCNYIGPHFKWMGWVGG